MAHAGMSSCDALERTALPGAVQANGGNGTGGHVAGFCRKGLHGRPRDGKGGQKDRQKSKRFLHDLASVNQLAFDFFQGLALGFRQPG